MEFVFLWLNEPIRFALWSFLWRWKWAYVWYVAHKNGHLATNWSSKNVDTHFSVTSGTNLLTNQFLYLIFYPICFAFGSTFCTLSHLENLILAQAVKFIRLHVVLHSSSISFNIIAFYLTVSWCDQAITAQRHFLKKFSKRASILLQNGWDRRTTAAQLSRGLIGLEWWTSNRSKP